MSANKTAINIDEKAVHQFEGMIPIPSYLVAIIAGNVEEK